MTTITVRKQSPGKKLVLTSVGGALVVLAVVTALGSWQNRGHHTAAGPATDTTRVEASVTADQAHQSARVGAAAGVMAGTSGTGAGAGKTLYIVGTNEEAGLLWEAINIAPDGPLGAAADVMVLDPETDNAVLQAMSAMEYVRQTLGQPPLRIVDMRVR